MSDDAFAGAAIEHIAAERRERLRALLAELAVLETLPGLAETEPLPSFAAWDDAAEESGDA